ncbi:hypothetical protein Zmor_015770 [Zophobas morio]|uniref:Uncharacterized protein n=1 Tax=Zophobas morio TaxID=2755281 RepID=A0AA38MGV3_9CUCU|nr:hypothetical protein Zmor_015770 [Zophobas morio]
MRDKTPMLKDINDRDTIQKSETEIDGKGRAENSRLTEEYKVSVKAVEKNNKLVSTFNPTPPIEAQVVGGDIIVRDEESRRKLRRNVVHRKTVDQLKRVEGQW